MTNAGGSRTTRASALRGARELSGSEPKRRSVRSAAVKQRHAPEGLAPEDVLAVVEAATTERDRLLLRVLWSTGARISALTLRPMDVRRDTLVLPNLKNPSRPTKQVACAGSVASKHGRSFGMPRIEPLFASLRYGLPITAGLVIRILCIRISFAMHSFVRSSAPSAACRSPKNWRLEPAPDDIHHSRRR
jgi:hypothetical protein